MYKKIFSLFVMSCCFLSRLISAGDNTAQGFLGRVRYRGKNIPVYAMLAHAPAEGELGVYRRSMEGDSIELYVSGEACGMVSVITPSTMYQRTALAVIGAMCAASGVTYFINKQYKKNRDIKKAAALAGTTVLAAMILYYVLWNPHIVFSTTYYS